MLKKIIIFTGSAVVSKAAPFLALPIVTRAMETAEYGSAVLAQLVATLILCVAGANIQTIVMRNFFKGGEGENRRLISTAVFTVIFSHISLYVLAAAGFFVFFDGSIFGLDPALFLLLVMSISLFQSLNAIHMAIKRCEGHAWRFSFYEISQAVAYVAVLLLLLYMNAGWLSIPVALLGSYFLVGVVGMMELVKNRRLRLEFHQAEWVEIINICSPQIVHLLSGVVLGLSDRFVIQWSLGESSVGIYSAYYMLGMGAVIMIDGIVRVWSPQAYKMLNESDSNVRKEVSAVTQGLLLAFAFFLVLYVLVIYTLEEAILAKEYLGFFPVFLFVVGGYFFQGIYKLMFPFFIHFSRSGLVAVINVLGAVVNFSMSVLLIERFGLYGVAFSTLLSFGLISVAMFLCQKRFFGLDLFVPFDAKRFVNALRN